MSYPTQPTYVVRCAGWEERLREHPVFDWMFGHEEAFDFGTAKQEPYTNWLTKDFKYTDPAGKVTQGPDGWNSLLAAYAPSPITSTSPTLGLFFENEHGYELFGCAKIFANLLVPGGGKKEKDLKGREWDVEFPGAFHFIYVRDKTGPKGLKISEQKLYADGTPLAGKLLERGMVTPEDLIKKLAG